MNIDILDIDEGQKINVWLMDFGTIKDTIRTRIPCNEYAYLQVTIYVLILKYETLMTRLNIIDR